MPIGHTLAVELPLPPQGLRFMGEDDERFLRVGDRRVADLRELAGLEDHSTVLDIGAGYGRTAHALWRDGFRGRYVGIEVLERHARWCAEELSQPTGFEFRHVDVRNARYNPKGEIPATEVRFDLEDGSVDIVLLASVFTHMYPREGRALPGRTRTPADT